MLEAAVRVNHFVTWQLVAALMRRHKRTLDLRVFELHPGGGQGHTLALYRMSGAFPGTPIGEFRGFRRLVDQRGDALLDDQGDFVGPWLEAADPKGIVDQVEHAFGRRPSTRPRVRMDGDVLAARAGPNRSRDGRLADKLLIDSA